MSAGTASSSSLSASRVGGNEHNKLDRRGCDGASDSLAAWVRMRAENYVQRLTLTTSSSPKPDAVSPSEVLKLFRQRTQAAKFSSKLSSDLENHRELLRKAREGAFCGRAVRLKAAEVDGHEPSSRPGADLCRVPVTWYPIARDQSTDVADGETLHTDNPLHFRYPDSFIGFTVLTSRQHRQNGEERKFEHFRFASRCSMREDWAPLRRSLCQDQVLAYYLSAAAGSGSLSALPVASRKRPPSKSKNKSSTSAVVSKTKSRKRSKGTVVGSESSRAEGAGARVGEGEADLLSGSATSEVQEIGDNDEPAKRCPRLFPEILEHIAEFLDPIAEVLYCPQYYCRLATSEVRAILAPAFRGVLSFCYDKVATKGLARVQVRLKLPLAKNEFRTSIKVVVADEENKDQGDVDLLGELAPAQAHSAIHCEVDIKGDAFSFCHWNACRSEDWANDLSRWKQKYPDIVTEKCISESSRLATLPERFIASMMHEYFSQERGMKVTIDSDDFREITLSWG